MNITILKKKLNKVVDKKGLKHKDTIKLSQKLDKIIIKEYYNKNKIKNRF